MFQGTVHSIHLAAKAAAPTVSVESVRAVEGKGLEGDRYFFQSGTFGKGKDGPDHEVTLIEVEAIEAIARDGIEIEPGAARRNIVTRDVPLNHLVGREFRAGEAVLRGLRLCEPCAHLEALCGGAKVRTALAHRGGLRAQVVRGGLIRPGDAVAPA